MASEASSKFQSRTPAAQNNYSNLNYSYPKPYQENSYVDENHRTIEHKSTSGDERGNSTPAFDE